MINMNQEWLDKAMELHRAASAAHRAAFEAERYIETAEDDEWARSRLAATRAAADSADTALLSHLKTAQAAPIEPEPANRDWPALGYVRGATVRQPGAFPGLTWDYATIVRVYANGALDVEKDGVRYGWSANYAEVAATPPLPQGRCISSEERAELWRASNKKHREQLEQTLAKKG
jgi:hypothetical protein